MKRERKVVSKSLDWLSSGIASFLLLTAFPCCAFGDEQTDLLAQASSALKNQEYANAEKLALKALAKSSSKYSKGKALHLLISIYNARNEIEKMEPILRLYCDCLQSIHGEDSLEFAASQDFYAKVLTRLNKNDEATTAKARAREIRSRISESTTTRSTFQEQPKKVETQKTITASISVILKATRPEIASAKRMYRQWDWQNGTSYVKGSLPDRLTGPAHEIARKHSIKYQAILNELEDGKAFIETFEGMLFMAEETAAVEELGWSQGTFVHIFPLRNRSHPYYGISTDENGMDDASKHITARSLD